MFFVCRINPTTRKAFVYLKQKVMNIKHQPLLNKLTENCIKLRYRCNVFKTVLSSGYILILLSIAYILASLIEMCQGQSRMRNVK